MGRRRFRAALSKVGRVSLTDSEVAIAAAEAGAVVLRQKYGQTLTHFAKSPTDFATEADLESEQAVLNSIASLRPEDAFIGEETGHTGQSDRTWLVDPLCGTVNYAARTSLFSVNVALRSGDRVEVAAVAEPLTNTVYWTDSRQAWIRHRDRDERLQSDPTSNLVDLDLYYEAGVHTPRISASLVMDTRFMERFGPRAVGSTLATTWVATGKRAAYVTEGPTHGSVHFSAPLAICHDAGCIVSDLHGNEVGPGSEGLVVAADRETHDTLLALIAPHLS